ncbi:MAG: hypothetical protein WD355_10405 [Balneolaceae bacterium]
MKAKPNFSIPMILLGTIFLISCSQENQTESSELTWQSVQDPSSRIHTITGFSGPEAVRYDPDQDLYFVSNFSGGGNDRDANGFISKVTTDGEIDDLEFITGTETHPLHAPRGMYITGDTLWAADVDGVHGFHTVSGEQVRFIDFTPFEPGFLNDIAADVDGNLYVTDTGASRLYQVAGSNITIVADSLPHAPNGITVAPSGNLLVLAPWGGEMEFYAWNPADASLDLFDLAAGGGNFDGIEFYEGRMLAASQIDSSLHAIQDGTDSILITMPGRPADIGLDTNRNQVAVPYIARNAVDIWQLPVE